MSGFDFEPFPATCGTLSTQQNALCSAVFEFVVNDAQIYTSQRFPIEKSLMKKIKQEKFNAIKACKAFENLLINHKKYIVEELNKGDLFVGEFGPLTTRKLDKDLRRHIGCLLVNHFLSNYEREIKKTLGIKDNSDDESYEYDGNSDICSDCDEVMPENCKCCDSDELSEEKEINIEEEKEIFISSSKNGTSKYCDSCGLNIFDECKCNDAENEDEPEEIKHLREVEELKNKIDELEEFESKYRKELYFHNDTKEALKGATEIINSYKQTEKELINEIKDLKNKNLSFTKLSTSTISEKLILEEEIKDLKFQRKCDNQYIEDLKRDMKDDKIYINDYEENFNRLVHKYNKLERENNEKNNEIEKLKESRSKILELLKKIVDNKDLII
jgi:hypothetical protein